MANNAVLILATRPIQFLRCLAVIKDKIVPPYHEKAAKEQKKVIMVIAIFAIGIGGTMGIIASNPV